LDAERVTRQITATLEQAGVEVTEPFTIAREPHAEDVDTAARLLMQFGAGEGDLVVALGGGSAIDLAKAAAAMATNRESHSVRDYLEGAGRGLTLKNRPLPVLAIPTTAGTGSEATKNAVISSSKPAFKKSLRSDQMLPRVVLVDPELTVSVPPNITANTGMDAITQLIESYISRRAQPIPQALALQGLQLALPAILEAYRNGKSRPAREAMSHAALLSGMALANSGLGMAHGVAAALGVYWGVAHGLACAVMLPAALEANKLVASRRLAELAVAVGERDALREANLASRFIERIKHLCAELHIPQRLSQVGVRREQIPMLVQASRGNSMSGNPRELTDGELAGILESML
jgi:alcohol dehydrogenase class IV